MKSSMKSIIKNKKVLVGSIAVIVTVVLLITVICINLGKRQNRISISTPELARAIEYEQFVEGDDAVDGTENVKFSAFFLRDLDGDGYAEKIKGTCKPISGEDTLYMEINVQTGGYLKDAKVEIQGQNFYLQTVIPKDEQLKDNYIGNNIKAIEFNQINNGTQKLLTGVVKSRDGSNNAIGNNINNYSREDNKIMLTGTYVNEAQEEIQITKEIQLTVDWYGTTKAEINAESWRNTYYDLPNRINEENGTIKLDFAVNTNEANATLNLSKNHVEGTIPELNGYAPTEVKMTNETSANLTFSYDETTKTFSIDRTATVGEDGTVTTAVARQNNYNIQVTYPIEAYQAGGEETVSISVPVQTYYEGYNNPNSQFTNPYKSNVAKATIVTNYSNPVEKVAYVDIRVGKYLYNPSGRYMVSKQKPLRIYNGISEEEKNDTYIVRWYAYTGTEGETTGLVLKETKDGQAQVADEFIKTDSSTDSMENITKNIGIYFSGADNFLKEGGWIKVYDEETGNLLVTFTKADWGKYTANNPYKYELPVKHIRVETSATNKESGLNIYNIKELNDEYITTNYTKEEFDNLQYIQSTLNGSLGGNHIVTTKHQANYEAPYSLATIGLSNDKISTQTTEEHEKITIIASYDSNSNQVGWVDGSFLVKLPEEILGVKINSVEIDNSSVAIATYELIEENIGKFIKINTKNNNDTAQSYTITIDADITPDPRLASSTRTIELYASNNDAVEYYYEGQDIYDVNDNLNTEEIINKTSTSISLVSPGSLLTNQTASEYDSTNNVVVSPEVADITPRYAKVDNEKQTAKIGIQLKNNYSSTISEVVLLGKIPFEGNTTVISGKNLNSEFTTKMLDTGITIPEELQGKVTVYYSENETPNRDLGNTENGWILAENVTNWDNIKTFLIDFGDLVLSRGDEYVFYYTIEIPEGVEFNKVSYSHHGVYFSLDTEEGKYRTQTEPNKIGFRIAEKFNLELAKTQTGKDKLVQGATYSVTEILEDGTAGDTKTSVTNAQGALTINKLYVERIYEIQEIKTPDDYELNSDIIRIIGHVDENGALTIEKTQGTTKEDITVIKNEGEMHKAIVKVEDEAKAKLKITKKEQGTENTISYVKYKLTGYGLPTSGRILTTNINGEATISGLKINEEYTLEETKAAGYYLSSPIKFKILNNDGVYSVEVIEGAVLTSSVTEEDSLPIAGLTLEDEKIPTYNLEIFKIKKTIETTLSTDELIAKAEGNLAGEATDVLAGAKFRLYKDNKEIGEYITGEDGKITIENLYQYVDGKDENATYTLKEVLAPDGYAKVKDTTFKAQVLDGTLKLINIDGEEEKFSVEGSTIKLLIEDSPSFKLIKKDAETGEVLANVKFVIYNVDDGVVPATNSKGEIIGTKEKINGREYYTVATDENGIITADLTEGLYKAVEVQAPDKYNIKNKEYYFGIGASREGKIGLQAEWAKGIGDGTSYNEITSVVETSDGGYIALGYFGSNSIDLGNGVTISGYGIIKYNSEGFIEWTNTIPANIMSVAKTSDGGCVVGGKFYSRSINLGSGVILSNNGDFDGILIKYSSEGNVEWAKGIGGSSTDAITSVAETSDEGYVVGGYFSSSSIDLGNGVVLNNSGNQYVMIIKYNSDGVEEWAKTIGGSDITSVVKTGDGGYIVGGSFSSSIDLGNEVTLSNNGNSDGMLIKYNVNGEVEWAKAIGGSDSDRITSVVETSDRGYVLGGYFYSSSIDIGNGVTLTNNSSSTMCSDGMLIKYNVNGEVEWAKAIGGSNNDRINSVVETSDGGYVVGGYFGERSIELGNGITVTNSSDSFLSTLGIEGMIVKYNSNGVAEWAKAIGGSDGDSITSVVETSNGGYVVGGYFYSSTIDLGNGVKLTKNVHSHSDAMIIKFSKVEVPEIVIEQSNTIGESSNDQITSVVATSDGGYIVGGCFRSISIELGNGVTLTNNSSSESYYDGMLVKYSSEGEVEWAKAIGGSSNDTINSVVETSDGGYVVGGCFHSRNIELGNGVTLTNNSSGGYCDGMLIKYNVNGEVEWAKTIGGSDIDSITSVVETSNGGYVVGGYFSSSSIDLGNGVTLINSGNYEGLVIKYSSEGNPEWAKSIGGSDGDSITSVVATSDGSYVVGGYFYSGSIELGNGVTLTNKSWNTSYKYSNGMLIKYNNEGNVEWAKTIGGSSDDRINSVVETNDGGYIVGGRFSYSTDLGNGVTISSPGIIKYNSEGIAEYAKEIGNHSAVDIMSVEETSDGGYIVGGYFYSTHISLGNGITLINNSSSTKYYDGMIIKYSSKGNPEWAKSIGGSDSDSIISVVELSDGNYIVGGYFQSSNIDLGDGVTLTNKSSSTSYNDGMLIKIAEEMGVPEVQELTVENERKEFKITTDVNEIDGIKGGSISGEDEKVYEKIKYGDNSTKVIIMTPDENYEIIGITVNGEEYSFTANEDGTYTMPLFTNVTEDKHIEVTYSLKDNKITINKIDSEAQEPLSGATFRLDQLEEREEPDNENIIGSLTDNGQEYDEPDIDKEVTDVLGELTANGVGYNVTVDTTTEVTGVLGELTNNGTYYFVEQEDGTLVPTNSKTYQVANGGTAGIQSVTANSYIPIDLTNVTGEYVVIVNANVTSESADKGYATITETAIAPAYNSTTGQFIYISGTVEGKDYTSMALQGGKTYYLHLGYRKDGSVDTGVDQIVFNSIKVYGATCTRYNFVENEEGGYESTNQGQASTVSNSYIPIDLTNMTGKYVIIVNANVSSQNSYDYGYATITESTDRPAYNTSTGRFIYISGTSTTVTTPTDYTTVLEGGKVYYLHLGYYKNASTDTGDDKFTVNSVEVYEAETVTYNFVENEEGKYESTNQGQASTVSNSYIPIDLTNYEGKYNLIVNANVSSQQYNDYGYATVTESTDRPAYNTSTGRFIYISGTTEAVTTPTDYKTVLEGGKLYYLHLGYYKNESTSSGDDKFTVNSISVTLNDSDLYHVEVTTNSEGQAITQIPFGKYSITEVKAPEGYELNENSIVVEFRADQNHEFTIENNKLAKVIVHHYIKDTTTSVAEDEVLQDKVGYQYTTLPHLDLEKYELEKDADGNYIMPENATGQFVSGEQEVIYYYVEKEIPLRVNHYIEGTETPVPLLDGNNAETVTYQGKEGETYATTAISNSELSNEYELVEIPSNSTGTYQGDKVEVTYYYRKVVRNITINKYAEDGVTPLEGAKFAILNKDESKNQIVKTEEMQNNGTYYFEKDGNRYISNNKGKNNTTANSYIKIDLTQFGNVDLTVNANISSESNYDYGYATITETTTAPAYNSSTGQFIKISGTSTVVTTPTDYTTQLEGGKVYYLHLGYRKDGSGNTGTDTFTINSIKINGTDYLEKIYGSTYITNNQGKIEKSLETGEYVITEIQAPDGYQLSDNATREITISRDTEEVSVDITNIKKLGKVTVHYYIEGTQTPITLTDGTTAQDVVRTGNVGDIYASTEANDISEKYELIEIPSNAYGTYETEGIEVIYYYRIKTYNITTRVEEQTETYITGETAVVKGGTISGEGETPYEIVEHGENSKKQIVVIPDDVHKVSKITINGVEQEFTENEDGTVTLQLFENVTEDKEVVVSFERIPTKIIVHHYIEGTTTKVPLSNGGEAQDELYQKQYGETYSTSSISNSSLDEYYELTSAPSNATGTAGNETIIVTYYYNLKDYELELTKYEQETDKTLSGVSFSIKKITTEETREYTTDENGKILINGLRIGQTYELQETNSVEGYLLNKDIIKFTTELVNGALKVKILEGNFKEAQDEIIVENANGDNPLVKVSMENEPIFTLIKKGNEGNNLLPGAKFVIKELVEENGTTVEKEAQDYYGNLVGQEEDINGELIRVVTTDENGEINEPLKAGNYKITEVQAPENYVICEENTYYFEVKKGQPRISEINKTWEGILDTESTIGLPNGKYIGIFNTSSNITIPAEYTASDQEIILTPVDSSEDAFIIKYNSNLKVDEAMQIGNSGYDWIYKLIATKDGGYVAIGEITGDVTVNNGELEISTENSFFDGSVVIKYNAQDKIEWITKIDPIDDGGYTYNENIIETKNGNFVIEGYADSTIRIRAEDTVNNQIIEFQGGYYVTELTPQGKVRWMTNLSENYESEDRLIMELTNGNYAISPSIMDTGKYTEISSTDGTIIQERDVSEIENAFDFSKRIEPTDIKLTNDGGIILIGLIGENQTIAAENTANGQEIELNSHEKDIVGFIVKFNSELKVEWAHTLDGISMYTKVISETDREYTVLGLFAETLTIENDETVNNEAMSLQAEGQNGNWLIVKYNSQGKIQYVNGSEVYTEGDPFATDIMQISEKEYMISTENSQMIFKETVQEATQAEKVELEVINTYNPPVLTYEKEATITRRAEEGTLAENEVTAGDTITYVIKVHNTGATKAEGIEVRDTAPTGTVLKTIENGGIETDTEIVWTIAEIEPNETAEVGFTVEVQYLRQDTTIRNKAIVEGKETNETENPYKKLPLVEESRVEKKATEKITTKDMKVYYEIKFTATINYFDGKAKIALVDTLPYPINVEESEIAGGTYDETTKTITWVEELNNLPVIIDGMTIERTKVFNLKYDYGNIDDITGVLINKINSRIDLLEPSEENTDEYVGVKVDEREAIAETLVEIPAQVKVHHYIYDAEKNEYTTVKLVEDETINGIIGQEYQTSPSSSIKNYSPINTTPEKYEGKMTEEIIEVTYYYQLVTPTVENTMEKTATASKTENGVEILTNENGEVTYDIKYNVTVKDYIGKATIEIVDTLPEVIDIKKSDLAGGRYDEATKTITWTENVEGIDTYTNGTFTKEITKQIKLVYSNQNVLQDLVNTVTGTTVVYYPESHTTKPGEELVTNTATDDETVKQEYKVTLRVNKKWVDNEDLKGKRPESVTIEIKGIADEEALTEVLNAENEWRCEITDLPKYDAEGNKIIYEVTEKETEAGDLEFYEDSQITNVETQTEEATNYIFTVINAYKLLNTDLITELTKGGTEEITSSKDVVEYTIKIKVEVIDYIGAGKVRIVDTLPYKIDEENSDLAGGIYDDEQQTITWEEELPHINTETLGESYKEDITKQIKVVYKDIDLSTDKMTNKVNGKVELYESEVKDEDETTHDTNINVDGKVIVRYVDKQTGKDIDENYNYTITGKVGADYTSESKEIENYYYIESTNNEKGKITEEDQEVIYYYIKTEATVLVKYQDTEGNELLPDVLISGKVLDNYTTEQKEIENYKFVSVTDNKEGVMTKEQIVVIYVYEKIPAKVIVKYIEKDVETGEEKELLPEETIEGFAGDDYKTERQVIENYKSAEPEPDNKTGKMTEEAIEVIYYYERIPSGIITVTYVDIDTKEEITYITETEEEKTYRYEIKGFVGDEYETEEKEIPYYEFVESTENTEGVLTDKEDTVTYYYRKLTFNFSVEKTVAGITLNEKAVRVTNNKLTKVEVRAKQIANTELIVSYDINVKNDGELKGKANIVEIIPKGYEVINQEEYWKATNGVLETEIELEAGEEKDLNVSLRWLSSENNIGTTTNIVKIDKIENAANYEEITTKDNTSSAQVIIGITTGPKFETIFKIELAMSVVIILLLVLNINEVSIIRKKK